jgi:hypothetical protein
MRLDADHSEKLMGQRHIDTTALYYDASEDTVRGRGGRKKHRGGPMQPTFPLWSMCVGKTNDYDRMTPQLPPCSSSLASSVGASKATTTFRRKLRPHTNTSRKQFGDSR